MRRIPVLILILSIIILSCEKSGEFLVKWLPEEPVRGETITIQYNAANQDAIIDGSAKINLIAEIVYQDSIQNLVIPMALSGEKYSAKIPTGENVIFMGFKLEDESGNSEDNDGRGWSVIFRDSAGKVVKNSYYNLGKTWDGSNRPNVIPFYVRAIEKYSKELVLYPNNFHVYGAIWRNLVKISEKQNSVGVSGVKNVLNDAEQRILAKLETNHAWAKADKNPEKIIQRIPGILDSLLKEYPKNEELLKLVFDSYRMLLNNRPRASYFGEKFLIEYPKSSNAATIAYHLIFLKPEISASELINKLEAFLFEYPNFKYKDFVFRRLANSYLMFKDKKKASQIFRKNIDANPDDFAGYLAIAGGLIDERKFDDARKYIRLAFDKCTLANSQKAYAWMNGTDRQQRLNMDKAGIHSSLARIRFAEQDYEKAIVSRMRAIELGTQFPAYEWEGVGQASLKTGKIGRAKDAFVEALSINPKQQGALNALVQLYRKESGSEKGFPEYINQAIFAHKKKSAKKAPDFEIKNIKGEIFHLAENTGKIVVLYFWATAAEHCMKEIPALNKLVLHFEQNPNVIFLAITIESRTTLKEFLGNADFIYRQYYNGGELKDLFGVLGFPTHIIIDGNGLERFRQIGYIPGIEQKLGNKINTLLSELVL